MRVIPAIKLAISTVPALAGGHELPIVDVDNNCLRFVSVSSLAKETKIEYARTCIHSNQESYNSLKFGKWEILSNDGQTRCLKAVAENSGYYYSILEKCVDNMLTYDIINEQAEKEKQIQNSEQSFKP